MKRNDRLFYKLLDHDTARVVRLLLRAPGPPNQVQLIQLATTPYELFEGRAGKVYAALGDVGLGEWIPSENQLRAERDAQKE